ncbi:MAG: hypothetical protein IPI67_13270 [Myxococcales bacterium]|nr:hypothetical protein [Myxococcales bacterium]
MLYDGGGPSGGALLMRVSPGALEDFVVFETAPDEPEVRYSVKLHRVAGLRMVANTLELIDAAGAPRLRVRSPYLVDATGSTRAAMLSLEGCEADTSPRPPWGRSPTAAGSDSCTLSLTWDPSSLRYPVLLDPAWVIAGEMVAPRIEHTATVLNDGRVLVAAAYALPGQWANSRSAEIFDPASETWAATAQLNIGRIRPGSVTLDDGRALVVGGACATDAWACNEITSAPAESYDSNSGTWQLVPNTPPMLSGPAVTRLPDGTVLVAGGCSYYQSWSECGYGGNKTSFLFTPSSGTWEKLADLPPEGTPAQPGHGFHTATLLTDGRVLVVGGATELGASRAVSIYEPSTKSWSVGPQLQQARGDHAATILQDGRVLVAGGLTGPFEALASAEIFDPKANAWQLFPVAGRTMFGMALRDDGSVIFAGGGIEGSTTPSAELFWPPTQTSTPLNMPGTPPRFHHTVLRLADGRVLVTGGSNEPNFAGPFSGVTLILDASPFQPGADGGAGAGGAAGGAGAAGASGLQCGAGTRREGDRCVANDESGCGCRIRRPHRDAVQLWSLLAAVLLAARRGFTSKRRQC